jgi:SH3-like domain-containing protein
MIRLVLLLCVGLYLTLLVLGQDNGQKRHGLTMADPAPAVVAPAEPQAVVFIPAQTVMNPPAVEQTAVAPPLPEPQMASGRLLTVSARAANVRQGPGTDFGVVGSLTQGEQVLVVEEDTPIDGWSRIRLEGDGIEGYIATRLLSE